MVVLDSGAITFLAERTPRALALLRRLTRAGEWPAVVPSVVLVECLTEHASRDVPVHRVLNQCDIREVLPVQLARRAAYLRAHARRGSAVDAVVVATAEPGGVALTCDRKDIAALAECAADVRVEAI
ncbi:MAG TPA: PIN domain-containing protein [Mycobacteriales bacterium]|nr:PIN domain-containing protein [Mycobacteriales bacterium]